MLESQIQIVKWYCPAGRDREWCSQSPQNGQYLAILSQHSYTNFKLESGRVCIGGGSSTLSIYRLLPSCLSSIRNSGGTYTANRCMLLHNDDSGCAWEIIITDSKTECWNHTCNTNNFYWNVTYTIYQDKVQQSQGSSSFLLLPVVAASSPLQWSCYPQAWRSKSHFLYYPENL